MCRAGASVVVLTLMFSLPLGGETGRYVADPAWPRMPAGLFFGTRDGFPDAAARAAQASAPREKGRATPSRPPFGVGVSGLGIDDGDRIYVFNRGVPPIIVFDREGRFVTKGGERDLDGQPLVGGWIHAGTVDHEGNVWVIERDGHRIIKFAPTLDRPLLQLGVTGQKGADAHHLNLPNGIVVMRNGNVVVTDGYGNNRVVMFDKNGTFIKQLGRGRGGPEDRGNGIGEFSTPHKLALDADDNVYVLDRSNKRFQVFDRQLNFLRQYGNPAWNPWDIAISRKGAEGVGFFAEHDREEVHKLSLADGSLLATFGGPGRAAGQFDWVHGLVVDSRGAVYAADTYGQRVQKFVLR